MADRLIDPATFDHLSACVTLSHMSDWSKCVLLIQKACLWGCAMQGIFSRLHSLLMPSLNSSFLLLMASFTCDHVTDNVVLNLTRRMKSSVWSPFEGRLLVEAHDGRTSRLCRPSKMGSLDGPTKHRMMRTVNRHLLTETLAVHVGYRLRAHDANLFSHLFLSHLTCIDRTASL